MRNKKHLTTFSLFRIHYYFFVFCLIIIIFFKFQLLVKMLNLIFIRVTWKLSYSCIKHDRTTHFMSRCKMINMIGNWFFWGASFLYKKKEKRKHFISPAKMTIFFRIWCQTFSKKMWLMGIDVPQNHQNNNSRPSSNFMINKTQLKSKIH